MNDNETSLSRNIIRQQQNKISFKNSIGYDLNSDPRLSSSLSKVITSLNQNNNNFFSFRSNQGHQLQSHKKIQNQKQSNKNITKTNLESSIQRLNNQIKCLRIEKDRYKLMQVTNEQKILITFSILTQKALIQSQIYQTKNSFKNITNIKENQIKQLEIYQKELQAQLQQMQYNGDIVMDINEQANVTKDNLEYEINFWKKILQETKVKNNKHIDKMKNKIFKLRMQIKQKEQLLIKISSQLCQLHKYRHKPKELQDINSNTKKDMNLNKIIKQQKIRNIQMIYVGNKTVQQYCQQVSDPPSLDHPISIFRYHIDKKCNLIYQCVYSNFQGKVHGINSSRQFSHLEDIKQIYLKNLLSLKIFFKHKIVGLSFQCRNYNENGKKLIQIGNSSKNIDNEFINLIRKKLIKLSSFWYQNQMVGIGVWYRNYNQNKSNDKSLEKVGQFGSNKMFKNKEMKL